MRVADALSHPLRFWVLVFSLCFFYNGIFPFMAEAPDFVRMKYGKSSSVSGVISGLCYDMSMSLSPFLGGVSRLQTIWLGACSQSSVTLDAPSIAQQFAD